MIAAARAALLALLTTEADFTADLAALGLGTTGTAVVPKAMKGNRRFEQIGQEHYPCWLTDAGDLHGASADGGNGDAAGLSLGSTQQDFTGDIELCLVWHQQDYDRSVDQLDALTPALARLLLRHPDLDGACIQCFLASVQTDRNYRHPLHVAAFTVRVVSTISRS